MPSAGMGGLGGRRGRASGGGAAMEVAAGIIRVAPGPYGEGRT